MNEETFIYNITHRKHQNDNDYINKLESVVCFGELNVLQRLEWEVMNGKASEGFPERAMKMKEVQMLLLMLFALLMKTRLLE